MVSHLPRKKLRVSNRNWIELRSPLIRLWSPIVILIPKLIDLWWLSYKGGIHCRSWLRYWLRQLINIRSMSDIVDSRKIQRIIRVNGVRSVAWLKSCINCLSFLFFFLAGPTFLEPKLSPISTFFLFIMLSINSLNTTMSTKHLVAFPNIRS